MRERDPEPACSHLDQVRDVRIRTPERCEECLRTGSWWVHLRLCLSCGHVGCCDNSPNKHATKHFHTSQQPLIQSFEPGEDWGWCYIDEIFLEPAPLAKGTPMTYSSGSDSDSTRIAFLRGLRAVEQLVHWEHY